MRVQFAPTLHCVSLPVAASAATRAPTTHGPTTVVADSSPLGGALKGLAESAGVAKALQAGAEEQAEH